MPREAGHVVELRHPACAGRLREDQIYFPFADGCLTYDCVACGAQCCRGHGYIVAGSDELDAQLAARPSLPIFIEAVGGDEGRRLVRNCQPHCFFLSAEGLCEIHAEHGLGSKPETCRLFPFNDFGFAGSVLVVRPHASLCPLGLAKPQAAAAESSHEQLIAGMAQHGLTGQIGSVLGDATAATAIIERERALVRESMRADAGLTFADFVRHQIMSDRAADLNPDTAISAVSSLGADVLGTPSLSELGSDRDLNRTLVLLTPYLRSQFIFDWPTSAGPASSVPSQRVPLAVLVIGLVCAAARRAGVRQLTFQTVAELSRSFRHIAELMAWADVAPAPAPAARPDLDAMDERGAFRVLVAVWRDMLSPSAGGVQTLAQILTRHVSRDPVARSSEIRKLARALAGKISDGRTRHGRAPKRSIRERAVGAAERVAVLHVGPEVLDSVYHARRLKRQEDVARLSRG